MAWLKRILFFLPTLLFAGELWVGPDHGVVEERYRVSIPPGGTFEYLPPRIPESVDPDGIAFITPPGGPVPGQMHYQKPDVSALLRQSLGQNVQFRREPKGPLETGRLLEATPPVLQTTQGVVTLNDPSLLVLPIPKEGPVPGYPLHLELKGDPGVWWVSLRFTTPELGFSPYHRLTLRGDQGVLDSYVTVYNRTALAYRDVRFSLFSQPETMLRPKALHMEMRAASAPVQEHMETGYRFRYPDPVTLPPMSTTYLPLLDALPVYVTQKAVKEVPLDATLYAPFYAPLEMQRQIRADHSVTLLPGPVSLWEQHDAQNDPAGNTRITHQPSGELFTLEPTPSTELFCTVHSAIESQQGATQTFLSRFLVTNGASEEQNVQIALITPPGALSALESSCNEPACRFRQESNQLIFSLTVPPGESHWESRFRLSRLR